MLRRIFSLSSTISSVNNTAVFYNWKRCASVVGNPTVDKALTTITGGRIDSWLQNYEELVGLREVKEAQHKVMEAEKQFEESVAKRRCLQQQVLQLHAKLKELHAALDKVQRGEERYLTLLTEEYEILREEKRVDTALTDAEQTERESFAGLSSAVRESHERERARAERTKYWSIIGSAIGATIGIIGTSVNNYRRMRDLKSLVRDSTTGGAELNQNVSELIKQTQQQQEQVRAVMVGFKEPAAESASSAVSVDSSREEILTVISSNNAKLENEVSDMKRMIAAMSAVKGGDHSQTVVYVGPEVQELLHQVEDNLEMKMKSSAVAASVALYVSSVVTVVLLYGIYVSLRSAS